MNGTCAGGTGAFIDQMATLLQDRRHGPERAGQGRHAASTPSPAAAASLPSPTSSRCSTRAPAPRTWPPPSSRPSVTQTVSGLACGHPITWLRGVSRRSRCSTSPQLRRRFIRSRSQLDEEHRVVPTNSRTSSWLRAPRWRASPTSSVSLCRGHHARSSSLKDVQGSEVQRLEPALCHRGATTRSSSKRHNKARSCPRASSPATAVAVFIGIDAGSTTMKCAVRGRERASSSTPGTATTTATSWALRADDHGRASTTHMPEGCTIGHVTTTGYGEGMLIEGPARRLRRVSRPSPTCAAPRPCVPRRRVHSRHRRPGHEVPPGATNGVIEHIMLNEACSSGCGSFIESFANSMDMTRRRTLHRLAVTAKRPCRPGQPLHRLHELPRQAGAEGGARPSADVAAGLSYSVIKNALFKVIKLRDFDEIGKYVRGPGRHLHERRHPARLRAAHWPPRSSAPTSPAAWAPTARRFSPVTATGATGTSTVLLRARSIDNLKVKHTHASLRALRRTTACSPLTTLADGSALHHGQPLREGRGPFGQAQTERRRPTSSSSRTSCCSTVPAAGSQRPRRAARWASRARSTCTRTTPSGTRFFTKLGFSRDAL